MVYMVLYAWLKLADIVQSPCMGDKYYGIDIIGRIDSELFEASVALYSYVR